MQHCPPKRSRLQISAEILQACRTPTVKTRLLQKLNLSFNVLQECLNQLQELKLIEQAAESNEYATTGKGLAFLEKWMQLQEFLTPEERVSIKKRKTAWLPFEDGQLNRGLINLDRSDLS